jgi:hypothetical protein
MEGGLAKHNTIVSKSLSTNNNIERENLGPMSLFKCRR